MYQLQQGHHHHHRRGTTLLYTTRHTQNVYFIYIHNNMKVYIHYDDTDDETKHTTLKIKVPKKWRSGPIDRLKKVRQHRVGGENGGRHFEGLGQGLALAPFVCTQKIELAIQNARTYQHLLINI